MPVSNRQLASHRQSLPALWRVKDFDVGAGIASAVTQSDSDGWIDIAVPGDLYLALHTAGRLPELFVHILCGGNDIAGNTGPSTPQDYQNNIMAMLDLAQCNGIKVLLGDLTPATQYGWRPEVRPIEWVRRLNAWLSQIAQARGAIYIDYFSAHAAEDRSMRAGYTNDGVHPNAAGYAAMKPLALAVIGKVLAANA